MAIRSVKTTLGLHEFDPTKLKNLGISLFCDVKGRLFLMKPDLVKFERLPVSQKFGAE
jgi:hypothetical protein